MMYCDLGISLSDCILITCNIREGGRSLPHSPPPPPLLSQVFCVFCLSFCCCFVIVVVVGGGGEGYTPAI